ncbi:hypothetical protein ABPG74_010169 [Tetrahymena malaccensis]
MEEKNQKIKNKKCEEKSGKQKLILKKKETMGYFKKNWSTKMKQKGVERNFKKKQKMMSQIREFQEFYIRSFEKWIDRARKIDRQIIKQNGNEEEKKQDKKTK